MSSSSSSNMGKCLQDYFAVNPLEDPIVKSKLEEVHMSGQQLIEMSVKELNKRLAGCSSFVVGKLKKCRRTLKNRGYAKSCRIKRIVAKSELEQINARLLAELSDLRQRNRSLADQVRRLLCSTTGGAGQQQMNRIRYELPADGPLQQQQHHHHHHHNHLLQQKRQQQELFHHHHEDPAHNTAAYTHGLGHHNYNHNHNHHHHSSGSSTCNSSPVSSSSSSSLYAANGLDAACRSLEAELDFVLDDHRAACHRAGVPPVDATANFAPYNELPGGGGDWSMGQHEVQTAINQFH